MILTKNQIFNFLKQQYPDISFDVSYPPEGFGDYSTNLAFLISKKTGEKTEKAAGDVVERLKKEFKTEFEKIEIAKSGFINFYLSKDFLVKQLEKVSADEKYGFNQMMKGETVMIEYTDPNPFKPFHIGHLMSNTIGEAIARLYEASGAKVIRVNYQGDVGLHVAKAVWAIKSKLKNIEFLKSDASLGEKMEFMGQAYAIGAMAYKLGLENFNEEATKDKDQIDEINAKIYNESSNQSDEIKEIYKLGRELSLEYFGAIYEKLDTKFDHYFFESEVGADGLDVVKEHPDVFTESDGAVIFRGENYGLHTRVFINSQGLPTYEAKELGLNKKKFDLYGPDLSIIVTGNEINDYFRVLLKVMELTIPETAQKTRHIGHGMMRLPAGKMSSRTGEVITADSLIEEVKTRLPGSDAETKESIAVGAIKYFILKQSLEHDIVFDFEKSVSVKGDAAPYLQYTYARLTGIKRKASPVKLFPPAADQPKAENSETFGSLNKDIELSLMKKLIKFPEAVAMAAQSNLPNVLALYLYELCNLANKFYESSPVLGEEDEKIRDARLALVDLTGRVLEKGLNLLGIRALERI